MEDYMKPSLDTPLDDAEFDELSEFLESIPDAMSIEMMDGFLAALICSPIGMMPSGFLEYVWGEEHDSVSAEDAEKSATLIIRHWNSISDQLSEGDIFEPVFIETDGHATGNEWATGFIAGMQLGGDEWNDYLDDEEHAGFFVPILMLAHENDPDPELRPEPIDEARREEIFAYIAAGVPVIYEYMALYREAKFLDYTPPAKTFKRTTRKIGRNEPCPCGSGKKYKKCCGRN